MHVTVDAAPLRAAAQRACRASGGKHNGTDHVRLLTVEAGLELAATDLEIGLAEVVPSTVRESGSAAVPARPLAEFLRVSAADTVELRAANGRMTIRAGATSGSLQTRAVDECPTFPVDGGELAPVDGALVLEVLRRTIMAAAERESRPQLTGVLLTVERRDDQCMLRAVASDGVRLAFAEQPVSSLGPSWDGVAALVPKKAAAELVRLLVEQEQPELSWLCTVDRIIARVGSVRVGARLIDQRYPDVDRVWPRRITTRITVARRELIAAVRRMSVVADDARHAVQLSASRGALLLSARDPAYGEAREEVAADYDGAGVVTGFDAVLLLSLLDVPRGEQVVLESQEPYGPWVVRDPDMAAWRALIMPVRLA
jgi:DNA polymerase-3 subunit beta